MTGFVVLDDDPTGTQAVVRTPVVLEPAATEAIAAAAERSPRAIHVLTNVRALDAGQARALTAGAARAARRAVPEATLLLRGDSALRAHLLPEYLGVRDAVGGPAPVLVLVPALPSAERITRDGVQLVRTAGGDVPLHETEYANDGPFAYRDARLLHWAEDRTAGLLPASEGTVVSLADLREHGAQAVVTAVSRLAARGQPAACAIDAEHDHDLEVAARGVRAVLDRGLPVLVRAAPAFAAILAGTRAPGLVASPRVRRVLVVCGSYVPATTRQLATVRRRLAIGLHEADIAALAADGAARATEVQRLITRAGAQLAQDGLALIATPRARTSALSALDVGERIAEGLAQVAKALAPANDVTVAKGGITSAVVARRCLGGGYAEVVGPVAPGVALWRGTGIYRDRHVAVFPGNVGGDDALLDLLERLLDVTVLEPLRG